MRKRIIILITIIIAVIVAYNYLYQDHRRIEDETAEFIMTSSDINIAFSENSTTAEQQYLNKTIEVSGLISEVNSNDITIDDNVFCQFSEVIETALKQNSKIKIKGRVIGYDDLLEQVKLDQCIIVE